MAIPEAWQQEYELVFLDGLGSWLTFDLIAGCEHDDAGKPDLYQGGPCFLGWDIARRNDLTVFWVLELVGDVLWTRQVTELPTGILCRAKSAITANYAEISCRSRGRGSNWDW